MGIIKLEYTSDEEHESYHFIVPDTENTIYKVAVIADLTEAISQQLNKEDL